jgi:hypothetical protein
MGHYCIRCCKDLTEYFMRMPQMRELNYKLGGRINTYV